MQNIYVTVGTTKFDALITEITSSRVLDILKERGCKRLTLQIGTGKEVDADAIKLSHGIEVEQYRFKFEPVRTDILNSDLTIGHAGAGTCMDILENKKPGLVVTNDELMNNHQTELAEQLDNDGHLYCCKLSDLEFSLETLNFGELKPYKVDPDNMKTFVQYLNDMMMAN